MYLEELYERLIEEARGRVRTGRVSERALARLCGVSQPHMHNVLKRIRTLSTPSADRLMRALDLNVPALVWRYPAGKETGVRAVPVLGNRIGPGTGTCFRSIGGHLPFPAAIVSGAVDPVAARLAPDLVMPRTLSPDDLVLLDQNPEVRSTPCEQSAWAVNTEGGIRIRYVRTAGAKVYLADESTVNEPARWTPLGAQTKTVLETIRARVVWFGRDMNSAA